MSTTITVSLEGKTKVKVKSMTDSDDMFIGECPFHRSVAKTLSVLLDKDKKRGTYSCASCGKEGVVKVI